VFRHPLQGFPRDDTRLPPQSCKACEPVCVDSAGLRATAIGAGNSTRCLANPARFGFIGAGVAALARLGSLFRTRESSSSAEFPFQCGVSFGSSTLEGRWLFLQYTMTGDR
jgi:hypothetical protein